MRRLLTSSAKSEAGPEADRIDGVVEEEEEDDQKLLSSAGSGLSR